MSETPNGTDPAAGRGGPSRIPTATSLTAMDVVLVGIAVGVLVTIFGFRFGDGNNAELVPLVLRQIDPSYLPADWTLNVTAGSAGRAGAVKVIAVLVGWAGGARGMAAAFFVLTLLAHASTAVVTGLYARDVFGKDGVAGCVAACLVVSFGAPYLSLGQAAFLVSPRLIPQIMAVPFAIGAVWAGARGRPILAGGLAGVGALLHPLVGLEVGALVLATQGAFVLARAATSGGPFPFRPMAAVIAGALLLAAFALSILLPGRNEPRIPTDRFCDILLASAPFHYKPSTFPLFHYLKFVSFLAAATAAWVFLYAGGTRAVHRTASALRAAPAVSPGRDEDSPAKVDRAALRWLGLLTVLVLITLPGGYLFAEVWPSRLWVTAQVFRLVFLVQWVGLFLIAGAIGRLLRDGRAVAAAGLTATVPLAVVTGVTYPVVFGALGRLRWGRWAKVSFLSAGAVGLATLAVAIVTRRVEVGPIDGLYAARLVVFLALVALAVRLGAMAGRLGLRAHVVRRALLVAGTGAAVVAGITWGLRQPGDANRPPAGRLATMLGTLRPTFDTVPRSNPLMDLTRRQTPADAVVLVPWEMEQFRLAADRASVVDFKLAPMTDRGLDGWFDRLTDCYGGRREGADEVYRSLGDAGLGRIGQKYGADYAIIPADAPTDFAVLGASGGFKLVRIGGAMAVAGPAVR